MTALIPLLVLTLPLYGIQSVWSTELAFAPPYLLSLGIPRGAMSLILLAAPLSGLLVQPIIGHYADNSTSKYGRRRPYMFVGTVLSAIAMLGLGYGKPIFEGIFGENSALAKGLTIAVAVLSLYVVDFCVNAVMAVDRALLVDVLPANEQDLANAWAARVVQVASIVGYWIGSIDLPGLLPFLGKTQIQVMSAITVVSLIAPHALVMIRVKETPLRPEIDGHEETPSFLEMMKRLWTTIRTLPHVSHMTFHVQFWSWLSQFSIFIFTTVYIGDIFRSTNPGGDPDAGTRAGSHALFYEGLVGLATIVTVPPLLQSRRWGIPAIWKSAEPRVILCATWAASQLISAIVMFGISVSRTVPTASFFVALNGYCMTVNHWIPFALVGESILLAAPAAPNEDDEENEQGTPLLGQGPPPKKRQLSAGAAMGILNAFICIPQFIIIGVSSLLFAILEPHRTIGAHTEPKDLITQAGTEVKDERSITLIFMFRLAAVAGLVAFYLACRLTRYLGSAETEWSPIRSGPPPTDHTEIDDSP
ncbi:hypothetical protein DL93DRAFT_2134431 [Clavulina sp. PMI_390]|nr:hypothetical protein DL93DRAFT_2134431 [Clavulina sp. PMI_390]